MFVLQTLTDTVRITPDKLGMDFNEAAKDELNNMLANKVIFKVGLCIVVKDILDAEASIIRPGEGATYTKVKFRVFVFRPDIDEIIVGKVKSVSPQGVHITLGFFDDIHIEPRYMQRKSIYCELEEAWIWTYEKYGEKLEMYLEEGDDIRFRVVEEKFVDTAPLADGSPPELPEGCDINVPYSLKGAICEEFLGELGWWDE